MVAQPMNSPIFPDPELADAQGLLAWGGDLAPETLLAAYRQGIFPWYGENDPILWWSPDPRMVLFPGEFHASRRLQRRWRSGSYTCTWDGDFAAVIRACAERPGQGTWIFPEMMAAYEALHRLGHAHSLEVWRHGELVGGLYGVLLGGVFFAESMFSRTRDGSKLALRQLAERAADQGWTMIDCQFHTGHLESLGARQISRRQFLALLHGSIDTPEEVKGA